MSHHDFKARALYDFVAEGPNELSFRANEILTITPNKAGNGWWYARNNAGNFGVIPENYVESLLDPPEPNEPPPPLPPYPASISSFSSHGSYNNGNNNRSNYSPNVDSHEYMNPANLGNWAAQSDPNNWRQIQRTFDRFPLAVSLSQRSETFQPSLSEQSRMRENRSKLSSVFESPNDKNNLFDLSPSDIDSTFNYETLTRERSRTVTSVETIRKHDDKNQDFEEEEEEEEYRETSPRSPIPVFAARRSKSFDWICESGMNNNDSSISLSSLNSSNDSALTNSCETGSLPILNQESPDSSRSKRKKKFRRIFAGLIRSKKHQTSNHSKKHDTDSDDSFSDSESISPTIQSSYSNTVPSNLTLSSHARQSISGPEGGKSQQPRARFFDKHGLDNYLLNGSKARVDKYVEITVDDFRGVYWAENPEIPPFSCKVEEPSKGTKLGGLKAFMEYKICPQIPGVRSVSRRYKQFDWLHGELVAKFRFVCIPPLPGKQISGRFDHEFLEERRRLLEIWLNRICRHPVLCASIAVQHFIRCEMADKDRKMWKKGKREVEKDELREASWLQCVTLTKTGLGEQQIQSQIETFATQQPSLESNLKTLSQGVSRYLEKCNEVYERDIQRVSELFNKFHQAVQLDTQTAGNKELSNSVSKISDSYGSVANLYKTKAPEGLRDFNERLQEYIGLVACFPSILSIQKSAAEFIRNFQKTSAGTSDFTGPIHRHHILNHVVVAEINFFQREKVIDLNQYMKQFVDEQIDFYNKVTNELSSASLTFK